MIFWTRNHIILILHFTRLMSISAKGYFYHPTENPGDEHENLPHLRQRGICVIENDAKRMHPGLWRLKNTAFLNCFPCNNHKVYGKIIKVGSSSTATATTKSFLTHPTRNHVVRSSNNSLHTTKQARNNNDGENVEFKRKSREEWINGKDMMDILEREEIVKQQQEQQQQWMMRQHKIRQQRESLDLKKISTSNKSAFQVDNTMEFKSKISYSDANTLQIEIPPSGMDSNVIFSGAFSALWFSAIAPATVSMLSGGIFSALFMSPFWLAGGVVAKMAVYDPFVSSKLVIGEYAWSLEKSIFRKRTANFASNKEEGATQFLKGASVNLAIVVNNVPKYELLLYYADGDDGFGKTASFGRGLDFEELEYLTSIINEHCTKFVRS